MASRTINGRLALDRRGVRERTGAGLSTITLWYANRATTGFPDTIPQHLTGQRRHNWWWADEIDAFHTAHQTAKRATLTPVDRTGDPDELLTGSPAAAVIGYTDPHNLPDALLQLADHTETLPSGRQRRHWKRSTLWNYADTRTGQHGGGPPPGSRNRTNQRHRTIDRTGDPNELVGTGKARQILGYTRNDSLPHDLYTHADHTDTKPSGRTYHYWKRSTLWAYTNHTT